MTDLLSQPPATVKPTTPAIMVPLRERFCAPEFAFFEEVGDSGSNSRVYADAVAVNMWASRGYAITGFEVKASRADWLRELKQPEKSEPILTKCDYWYLVAPDEVYQPDEVPVSWGILSFKDGRIREKRRAPKLEPKPITRAFVAQMFRRAHVKEERDISARIAKALANDHSRIEQRIASEVQQRTRSLRDDGEKWKRFCETIGQSEWSAPEDIGHAVKIVMKSGVLGAYGGIEGMLRQMRGMTKSLEEAAAMFVKKDEAA